MSSLTRADITSVRLKYAFDLFAATVGLMALTPIFLCIAVVIKIDSPGPVFFRQERVGRQGRPFRIHKFRTMRTGAEQDGKLTVASDPRVTRVGRYLRKMKLDELPQLFDILSGSMSLVGPRPEVPRYVALYPPEVRQIVLSVKPGVTDPASIAFRNESEMLDCDDPERLYIDRIMPAKLAHYVDYVRTRSFVGDLRVIVRTIEVICTKGRAPA
jgi:lipopolysaccharide/colanic/teichoic acid biosynthesis glycosyltransferase